MDELRSQLLVRTIAQLDGVRTNVHDQMMLVWQRSRDRVMNWRRFGLFSWASSRRATKFVRTAGGRAANNSLYNARSRLKIICNSFHGSIIAAPFHRRTCVGVSAFVVMSVAALNRCPEHQCICRCVWYTGVFDINVHICEHTRCKVFTCARVRAVCSLALRDEGGGF